MPAVCHWTLLLPCFLLLSMPNTLLSLPADSSYAAFHPGDVLERCEQRGKMYHLDGHSALIITTSHKVLGNSSCSTCKPTGVFSAEMSVPYYVFQDAGLNVSIASIRGGRVPIDPTAKMFTSADARFYADDAAIKKIVNSPSVDSLDLSKYDIVWVAGGWGAAWDLAGSPALIQGLGARWTQRRLIGTVCHGALALVNATKPDGTNLVEGLNITAVTNRQIEELGIAKMTPMHPQTELVVRGANFMSRHGLLPDVTQSLTVVDGVLVTGQNQNSGCETAQRLLDLLADRML